MTQDADTRLVAGIMSGTSLDGVDVTIAQLTGHGTELCIETLSSYSSPYNSTLKDLLLQVSTADSFDMDLFCQLNVRLAHEYARVVREAAEEAGIAVEDLDLAGSHGQTVRHLPKSKNCVGLAITSTLQIGDPSVLAQLLGVPVVGDFRLADMALGGQGAPLVPYFDYVALSHPTESRACLNLGGIANLTVLPAGQNPNHVFGFDTGPANMVLDALAKKFLEEPYDRNGEAAARGTVNKNLLEDLLKDDYFRMVPPKSTGREYFGPAYVEQLISLGSTLSVDDFMATITALTAASVHKAYMDFVDPHYPLSRIIVAGGGIHNLTLLRMLQRCFGNIPIQGSSEFGIDEDAKEALCFAVLAHETASGYPTGMPSVTGARQGAILGKICPVS